MESDSHAKNLLVPTQMMALQRTMRTPFTLRAGWIGRFGFLVAPAHGLMPTVKRQEPLFRHSMASPSMTDRPDSA